jgi:D-alanine-D-alanine ligase
MELNHRQMDLPVLLLHNLDPCWEPEDADETLDAVQQLKAALEGEGHSVVEAPVRDNDLERILEPFNPEQFIVFNWCEELPGLTRSDARVAAVLEDMGFTYTGSPSNVLALSWDKPACKSLLNLHGIPTPTWQIVTADGPDHWNRFPAIVKPAFEHCSVGISREAVAMNPDELASRIAFVHEELQQAALIEDFIDGREFHVTLLGNGVVEMLPPAEMDYSAFDNPRDRLCSFDSKFTPGSIPYESIEIRVPARLNAQEHDQLRDVAMRAYEVFNCRDYGRIDLRSLNGRIFVLDINPNADVSPDTSLALAAEAAGLGYGRVASQLVHLAAARHPLFGGAS